ncbi:splicing factor 3B subunit 3, partial [Trichonephila inaurata madagascariensis]
DKATSTRGVDKATSTRGVDKATSTREVDKATSTRKVGKTGRRQHPCTSGIGKTAASTSLIDQATSMSGIGASSSMNLIDLNLKGITLPIMDSVYQAAFKSAFDQDSLTPTNLFDQSVATNTFHQATSTSEMDQAAPTSELGLASSTSDQIAYLSKNYPLMFFDQTASESFDDHVMPEISTGQVESTNLDPQTTDSRLIFNASSTEPQPTFHDIFQSKRGASIYVPPIFPNLKPQATYTNLIYQSASTRVLLKVKSTNVKDHAASTSGMHPNASTSKDMVCNEPFHDDIKKDSTDGVIGVEVSHESSSNESHLDGERNSTPNLIVSMV